MGGGGGGTVDPSGAINAFQSGADVIQQQFPIALAYYERGIGQGIRDAQREFSNAETASFPFVDTAEVAVDELRGFLGLKPVSKTGTLGNELRNIGQRFYTAPFDKINTFNNVGGVLQSMANKLDHAEGLEDGTERLAAREDLLSEFGQFRNGIQHDLNVWFNHTTGRLDTHDPVELTNDQTGSKYKGVTGWDIESGQIFPVNEQVNSAENREARAELGVSTGEPFPSGRDPGQFSQDPIAAKYDDQYVLNVNNAIDYLEGVMPEFEGIAQTFTDEYKEVGPTALTATQITEKLEDLPEYQFQFAQGTKALKRSQAARGTLTSGNALLEAQQFGQDLAQNIYSGHVQRLAGLAGLNMPVVQQANATLGQTGQTALNVAQNVGQTRQGTIQDIARSRESAFIRQGQALMQAQMANAQSGGGGGGGAGGIGKLAGTLLGGLF